jgi:hypothetical protein
MPLVVTLSFLSRLRRRGRSVLNRRATRCGRATDIKTRKGDIVREATLHYDFRRFSCDGYHIRREALRNSEGVHLKCRLKTE